METRVSTFGLVVLGCEQGGRGKVELRLYVLKNGGFFFCDHDNHVTAKVSMV